MNPISKLALGLILLFLVLVSSAELDFGHCQRVLKTWSDSSSSNEETLNKDKRSLHDLLFFLHVPRTGGKIYFYCFLRKLYDNSEECPRSYKQTPLQSKSVKNPREILENKLVIVPLLKEKTCVVTLKMFCTCAMVRMRHLLF